MSSNFAKKSSVAALKSQPQKSIEISASAGSFVQLFEADKNRLYTYIFAYVMDYAAADDIFQETSMTLWREFSTFELGTNFSLWANCIAFNRVRAFRDKNKKYTLGLSEDFSQTFDHTVASIESTKVQHSDKWWHLQYCSNKLSAPLTEIYHAFYLQELKAKEIAKQTNRSVHAIRKAVHKLRRTLFDCVKKQSGGDSK